MIGWESMAARATAAGIGFTAYRTVPPWPPGLTQDDGWQDRMEPLLHGIAVRNEIVTVAQVLGTDVLIVDCMLGAGFAGHPARPADRGARPCPCTRASPTAGATRLCSSVVDLLAQPDQVLALTPPSCCAGLVAQPRRV